MIVYSMLGQAITGWVIACLLSGVVHWWLDRIRWPNFSLLEKWVYIPNNDHHADTMKFVNGSWWYRNNSGIITSIIFGATWLAVFGPSVVLLFAFVGGCLSTQSHYWAHKRPTGFIKVLQQVGVFQTVREHAGHHKPPQNKNYCSLSGWTNPVVEYFRVWELLEKVIKPRHSFTKS